MLVDRFDQHVRERGDVTAGTGPVQAGAVVAELGGVARQQGELGAGEGALELLGVDAAGEAGGQLGPGPGDPHELLAVVRRVRGEVEPGLVELAVGIEHVAARGPGLHIEPLHAPGAGVGLPAAGTAHAQQALGGVAQGGRMPALPDRSAAGDEPDAHESSSSRRSRRSSRSSSREESQSSPGLIVISARDCLSASTVSIFSSTVPALTSLCTVTSLR